jgi:peroxiredoxin
MASAEQFATVPEAFAYARELDASINQRLQVVADAIRRLLPAYADAVDRLVARLEAAGAGGAAPDVGEPMPDFLLPDEAGRLVGLEALLADGPAALAFHRGYWCSFCRLNTTALAEAEARLARGRIVAITPDRQKFAAALKAQAGAGFPVLTDMDNGYALALNLSISVGEELKEILLGLGVDVAASQGAAAWTLPIPATFVVGSDGVIAARMVDPDFRRRMDIDELVAALAAAP